MIYIITRIKKICSDPQNLIYITFISVFFHYIITAAVVVFSVIGLLLHKTTRKQILCFKGRGFLYAFTIFTSLVALYFKNYLGFAAALGFFIVILLSYFVRSIITEHTFEQCLDIACWMSIPISLAASIEYMFFRHIEEYRCALWFLNANYMCALLASIVIICAFKATSHKSGVLKYYICAVCTLPGLLVGGSLFALVEIFVGICVLLILKRKHTLLAMFLMAAGLSIILIFFIPDLLPRLSDSESTTNLRIRIWNESMLLIKENPLFGNGFLSYRFLSGQNPAMYQTGHAHNFAVESLLSFGIIGSALLLLLLWSYYSKVAECKELLRNNTATTLILSISAAVLIHSTTDITLLWINTGVFYGIILGAVGIDEKALNKRILACAQKGGASDNKTHEKPTSKE